MGLSLNVSSRTVNGFLKMDNFPSLSLIAGGFMHKYAALLRITLPVDFVVLSFVILLSQKLVIIVVLCISRLAGCYH